MTQLFLVDNIQKIISIEVVNCLNYQVCYGFERSTSFKPGNFGVQLHHATFQYCIHYDFYYI